MSELDYYSVAYLLRFCKLQGHATRDTRLQDNGPVTIVWGFFGPVEATKHSRERYRHKRSSIPIDSYEITPTGLLCYAPEHSRRELRYEDLILLLPLGI